MTDRLLELAGRDPENFARLLRDEPYRFPATVAEARREQTPSVDDLAGDDEIEAQIRRMKKKLAERRRKRQVGAQRRARAEAALGRSDPGSVGDVDLPDASVGEADRSLAGVPLDRLAEELRPAEGDSGHEGLVERLTEQIWEKVQASQPSAEGVRAGGTGREDGADGREDGADELREGDRIEPDSIGEGDRLNEAMAEGDDSVSEGDDRERTEFPTPEQWVHERADEWRSHHGRQVAELRQLLEGSWPEYERQRERKIEKVLEHGLAKASPPSGEEALAEDFERGQALGRRAFARRLRELREGHETRPRRSAMSLSRKPTSGCFESPWEDDDERAERLEHERVARRWQEVSAAHGMAPDTFARETLSKRQLAKEVAEAMRAAGPPPRRIPSVSEEAMDELGEVIDEEYPR